MIVKIGANLIVMVKTIKNPKIIKIIVFYIYLFTYSKFQKVVLVKVVDLTEIHLLVNIY